MAIKIHHGAPGSYKTSGAIQDDLLSAFKEGREIITNIRGLDDQKKIFQILKKRGFAENYSAPSDIKIKNIDTSREEGREEMRHFFHWAPKGAFFIIDEINTIYPTEWKETQLKAYDFPGGVDEARSVNRPPNVREALEMHRHHNWDFSLTTPNITKVHKIFKDVAEVAYRHRNLGALGVGGRYGESMHYADTTGRNQYDIIDKSIKRIKPWVFDLYKSTATGDISDTKAGKNIFTQKKVIFLVVAIAASFYYFLSSGALSFMSPPEEVQPINEPLIIPQAEPEIKKEIKENVPRETEKEKEIKKENPQQVMMAKGQQALQERSKIFTTSDIFYVGEFANRHYVNINNKTVKVSHLEKMGVTFEYVGDCLARLNGAFIACEPTDYSEGWDYRDVLAASPIQPE